MISNTDIYFRTSSGFSQPASFWPVSGSGSARVINVIYDSEYSVNIMGGVAFSNTKPTALCRTTDVSDATGKSNLVSGSVISIGGNVYKILEVQPEGTGTTTLVLSTRERHG